MTPLSSSPVGKKSLDHDNQLVFTARNLHQQNRTIQSMTENSLPSCAACATGVLRSNGLKRRLVRYVVFGKNKLKCKY